LHKFQVGSYPCEQYKLTTGFLDIDGAHLSLVLITSIRGCEIIVSPLKKPVLRLRLNFVTVCTQIKVRCPGCTTLLALPQGTSKFKCAVCSTVAMVPAGSSATGVGLFAIFHFSHRLLVKQYPFMWLDGIHHMFCTRFLDSSVCSIAHDQPCTFCCVFVDAVK
jgi:LSD1 subclass zinc finger protein